MPIKTKFPGKTIVEYRNNTYRFSPQHRIHSERDAVNFVNERGLVFFWPIKNIPFPSLWGAAAGDRPVPNNHDDPGQITWRWKDSLLNQRKWYYAKVLRRKSTIISLDMVQNFFALSDTIDQTIEDIEYLFRIGKMTNEEQLIYSALFREGPLDSIEIKKRLAFDPVCSEKRYDQAMLLLQRDFRIMPIGLTTNGRWHYAYLYELVQNYYPELIQRSNTVSKDKARTAILHAYFNSNGAGTLREIRKVFRWDTTDIIDTLEDLQSQEVVSIGYLDKDNEETYILDQLINEK